MKILINKCDCLEHNGEKMIKQSILKQMYNVCYNFSEKKLHSQTDNFNLYQFTHTLHSFPKNFSLKVGFNYNLEITFF